MNRRTTGLLLFLLLLPTLAFASGNEIIPTLWLMAGSLLLFFQVLFFVRLPLAKKAVLAAVYLLTMWAVLYGSSWLPFLNNLVDFNLTIAIGPVCTTVATWFLLHRRKRSVKE